MTAESIPVFRPLLTDAEIGAATGALEMGWLGMGSYVGDFEAALQRLIGADDRHVVAVSTGHAALHLGLLAAGVGPGDEVITPSFNNVADLQAIVACGAEPVFCDIDDDTLCIDVDRAAALIGPRTKAMIVMDYDCCLCDHDRIADLAASSGIRVVHDAAHSLGSTHRGRPIGSFSDIAMFSFDPVKTVTCIDGGALVVRSEEERDRIREMRLIGMGQPTDTMYRNQRAWTYDVNRLGFRYHLANLHAAIGLAQLDQFDHIATTRRETSERFNAAFQGLPGIAVPKTDFVGIVPFLYYLRVADGRRDDFRDHLTGHGVDTGIHWQPGHHFSLFRGCRRGPLDVTERVAAEVVSLPLHSAMAPDDESRVIEAVRSFAAG